MIYGKVYRMMELMRNAKIPYYFFNGSEIIKVDRKLNDDELFKLIMSR